VNGEERIYGRGDDFAASRSIPRNKDTIYVANTSTYRSTDGGKTFTAYQRRSGGDDYTPRINPDIPTSSPIASIKAQTSASTAANLELLGQPATAVYHDTDNQVSALV